MSKWYDHLVANGATAEEAKTLDTPTASRLLDKQQSDAEAAAAKIATLDKNYKDYQVSVNGWHEENNAKLIKAQNDAVANAAESARAKAALMELQTRGLIDVAKDFGWTPEPPKVVPPALDDRYVSLDKFQEVANSIGDNLAALEDMVMEHKQLFPDRPLSVRQLRNEALAAKKSVHEYWESKYKVGEARETASKIQRDAEIAKWKAEGAKEKETELVSKFGNPETRPMVPSHSPFTPRPADPLRKEHPWNQVDGKLQADRVARRDREFDEEVVELRR